jgi:hypothetical protein
VTLPVTHQKRESIAQFCYWVLLAACLAVPAILSVPSAFAVDIIQRELERVSPPAAPLPIKPGKV